MGGGTRVARKLWTTIFLRRVEDTKDLSLLALEVQGYSTRCHVLSECFLVYNFRHYYKIFINFVYAK